MALRAVSDGFSVLVSLVGRGLPGKTRARLVGVALCSAIACGGSAFSTDPPGGGGSSTGGRATAGGEGVVAGAAAMVVGGSSEGGQGAGAHAGEASVAEAGSAGAAPVLDCSELQGLDFADQCYVDVTAESVNQLDAVAACANLASRAGREAQLLVLGSEEEEEFIVDNFLSETTDAWLALTCSSEAHPQLTDCYCLDCEDGTLLEKRATWSWADGSSATFGWSGSNPNGAVRCSALAYNPTIATWGWVDRSCLSTVHQIDDFAPHSYRVICELP